MIPQLSRTIANLAGRLAQRRGLLGAVKNVSWLSLDNFINVAVSAVMGIVVARAIGAAAMGIWGLVIAIYTLALAVAGLGMDQVLIVDLVNPENDAASILATAFFARLSASLIAAACLVGSSLLLPVDNPYQAPLLWAMCGVLVVMSLDVCGNWFRSQLMFRFVVIPSVAGNLIGGVAKAILVIHQHSILPLGYISIIQAVIVESLLFYYLWNYGVRFGVADVNLRVLRTLLAASLPLMFSSIAVFIYTRSSIFLLDIYRTKAEIGLYTAATRISELLYFFPIAVATVVSPTLYKQFREDAPLFERNFRFLLNAATVTLYLIALCAMLLSHEIVTLLFGPAFAPSAVVLTLHVWTLVPVAQGVITGIWLMAERRSDVLMLRTVIGGIANVILSIVLIPRFGILGAASSTLISMMLAGIFVHGLLGKNLRHIMYLQIRSLLLLDLAMFLAEKRQSLRSAS